MLKWYWIKQEDRERGITPTLRFRNTCGTSAQIILVSHDCISKLYSILLHLEVEEDLFV
jgi:hypothetical protein